MTTDESRQRTDEPTGEVEHGVRIDDHMEFIDWMEANPDDALIEFRASGDAEEVTNRTTATIADWSLGGEEMGDEREHALHFGLPPELEEAMAFEEPTDRYEAIEGALAGLTACINGTIVFNAIREGIDVEEVRTRVGVPTDLRLLFGIHDLDRADEMYDEPRIEVEVTGENITDEERAQIEEFPKRSPVYNLVTLAHDNTPDVTVNSS
jgi:hypothetical protein